MTELDCWTDQKTFTCITPEGQMNLDHWLFVGKGMWDQQNAVLRECEMELSK